MFRTEWKGDEKFSSHCRFVMKRVQPLLSLPLLIFYLSLYVYSLLRSTESSFSCFIPFPIPPICIDIIFNSVGLGFNTLSSQDYGTGDIFI